LEDGHAKNTKNHGAAILAGMGLIAPEVSRPELFPLELLIWELLLGY
jgi:hypothetical protein